MAATTSPWPLDSEKNTLDPHIGPELNIPGFVRVDAALYYNHDLQSGNWLHAKQVNVALNVRNMFDQGYIESGFNSTTRLFFGEPRTVFGTVGLHF